MRRPLAVVHGRSADASALRLLVRTAADVVEIGRCLSLDERRAVAPVIAAALDAATESRR
jgi:hypothetical protein